MRKWMIVVTLAVAACSSDDGTNNGSSNNGATNNGATNNGSSNNGATNNSATNNGATNNGGVDMGADAGNTLDMQIPDAGVDMGTITDRVAIPAGTFSMGCAGVDCAADEMPQHDVMLSAFELDRTEVSQLAYQACIEAGSCTPPSDNFDPASTGDLPVVSVTWDQAQAYCAWAGGQLPTEAQWERACTGGDAREFAWGDDPATCDLANTAGCGPDDSNAVMPVDSNPGGASAEGALNLVGNVWEWTADFYGESAYADHAAMDPTGPTTGDARVYRGGGSGNAAQLGRCRNRADTYNPAVGGSGLGFRCAY